MTPTTVLLLSRNAEIEEAEKLRANIARSGTRDLPSSNAGSFYNFPSLQPSTL